MKAGSEGTTKCHYSTTFTKYDLFNIKLMRDILVITNINSYTVIIKAYVKLQPTCYCPILKKEHSINIAVISVYNIEHNVNMQQNDEKATCPIVV